MLIQICLVGKLDITMLTVGRVYTSTDGLGKKLIHPVYNVGLLWQSTLNCDRLLTQFLAALLAFMMTLERGLGRKILGAAFAEPLGFIFSPLFICGFD